MTRWIGRAWLVWCLAWAALLAFAFYDRYWRWRDCFNELGRCYDPVDQMVYLEQAGVVWGGLLALALILAAPGAIVAFRPRPAPFSQADRF